MANHNSIPTPKQSAEIVKIENAEPDDAINWLQQYPLLREKSPEELAALNKAVLKKLDWKFLPCITLMLLMKYAFPHLPPSLQLCACTDGIQLPRPN